MKTLEELGRDYKAAGAADFVTMARALLLCRGTGAYWHEAARNAEALRASDRVQRLTKAGMAAGTLSDPSSAPLADLRTVSSGFVSSLASIGAFDRMLADGAIVRVPLDTPLINVASRIAGYTVGEGQAKPIRSCRRIWRGASRRTGSRPMRRFCGCGSGRLRTRAAASWLSVRTATCGPGIGIGERMAAVKVEVRGLEELKRELARLDAAVPEQGTGNGAAAA